MPTILDHSATPTQTETNYFTYLHGDLRPKATNESDSRSPESPCVETARREAQKLKGLCHGNWLETCGSVPGTVGIMLPLRPANRHGLRL